MAYTVVSGVAKPHSQCSCPPTFHPGFIRRHDGTPANGGAQRLVGWLGVARGPVDRLHETTGRHMQSESLAEQGRDLAKWQPELLVQHHGEGHDLRPEVHRRRPERI